MTIKEFKEAFHAIAEGVPPQGANSGQWKKVVELVSSLEAPTPIKTTKQKE